MEPDLQFAEDPIISTSPPQNRIEFSPAYHDDDNEFGMDSSFQDQHFDSYRRPLLPAQLSGLASTFRRVIIDPPMDESETEELEEVYQELLEGINLRNKYLFQDKNPYGLMATRATVSGLNAQAERKETHDNSNFSYKNIDGVFHVYHDQGGKPVEYLPPCDLSTYYRDLNTLLAIASHGPCKTFTFKRLRVLDSKFDLHKILNEEKEKLEQKKVPHRDFYNVYKVDTHIHLSSAMNQKHLLKFIKRKLREEPEEMVIFRDGKNLSLKAVFESLKLSSHELSVDTLDVHADQKTFHRFDRFNLKYNPIGESRLREIFLKSDNMIKGRFLAETIREVIDQLEASKYQCSEFRVSVYGRSASEWEALAAWVIDHNLISDNVRFLVQIPRLYSIYKSNNLVTNFQQMVENIFKPLFEVTLDPSKYPKLHEFLKYCVGIDCVDDESKPEARILRKYPAPSEWNLDKNPPYTYYLYYLYANLYSLNRFREARGFSTLHLRPHSGEAGDVDHLASAFMLSQGIAHGIMLRKSPVLQYLFYLMQVPIYMSPLSNNSLFLDYSRNPFPVFFGRGMNVSLSTDDPLQFHYTKEPLIEEYSIAAQVWKLTTTDICEVAQNSVLHSGFPAHLKREWLGPAYFLPGVAGNEIAKSNVPTIRRMYRHETLIEELKTMFIILRKQSPSLDLSYLVAALRGSADQELGNLLLQLRRGGRSSGSPQHLVRGVSEPAIKSQNQ